MDKRTLRWRRGCLGLVVAVLLAGSGAPLSAQDPSKTLAALVQRATQPQFFEYPDLAAAFLAADLGPSPDPSESDSLSDEAILRGVGEIEQRGPSTDQQKGASAESSGTTTVAEKTGIAELLNLAIERGAITKTTSGTSFTLQTTPYMLYSRLGAADTADTWEHYAALRKIAISATFDQSEGEDPGRDNFDRGELKYAVFGERSPRDLSFRKEVRPAVDALIQQPSSEATAALRTFAGTLFGKEKFIAAQKSFNEWRNEQPKPIPPEKVLEELHKELDPLRSELTDADRANLKPLIDRLSAESKALAAATQLVAVKAKLYIDAPRPQLSLSYAYQRDAMEGDFSSLKVLSGYKNARLSFNLNGEVMVNNDRLAPNGTERDRVRAYSAETGLTFGKFAKDAADFTAAAKFMRPEGDSHDMRFVQAKLNLYLIQGVTIPVALTYANRTEDSPRSHLRLNVGFSLNGDSFLGVARKAP